MALAEIGARLRLQGAAAFRRDAERAGDSVDRLGREARDADRDLGRMGSAARRAGGMLGSLAKGGAIGAVGAAAVGVGALGAALYQGFQDAAALQTVLAKTNAVIKSTDGAANVSAKSIVSLADELESMSGVIDGDAIIQAQNLLLTFTKVRNETGQVNHVFDQATRAAVDMAVALGQDPAAAAMQLGKALNDPIKGVSALGKAGVSFTEDQKKTIKTLVASNKVMDAQKIILGEMQVQFGGAAKAAGAGFEGSMGRAKDAIGDLFRDVATPLLDPVTKQVERFSRHVNEVLAPAMIVFTEQFIAGEGQGGRFRDRLKEVWTELRGVGRFALEAYEKAKTLVQWMSDHTTTVKVFGSVLAALYITAKAMAVLSWISIATGIGGVGVAAGGAATGVGAFGTSLAALAAVGGPIAVAVAAIGAVGGLVWWLNKAESSASNTMSTLAGLPTATTGSHPRINPNNPLAGQPAQNGVNVDLSKPLYDTPAVAKPVPDRPGVSRNNNRVMAGDSAPINLTTTVVLDRKIVGESVVSYVRDTAARR